MSRFDDDCARDMGDVTLFARRIMSDAETGSRDLMEGILAHGVRPTLKRRFAMVKNASGPVSTKAAAETSDALETVFRDGSLAIKGKSNN